MNHLNFESIRKYVNKSPRFDLINIFLNHSQHPDLQTIAHRHRFDGVYGKPKIEKNTGGGPREGEHTGPYITPSHPNNETRVCGCTSRYYRGEHRRRHEPRPEAHARLYEKHRAQQA